MSILIKGVDIPKDEHERITVQIGSDGAVYLVTDFELKAEVYKFNAVEVPEPHGRLIDERKISLVVTRGKQADGEIHTVYHSFNKGTVKETDAPTVIEAER